MTKMFRNLKGRAIGEKRVFPGLSRTMFESSYPEGVHKLDHSLVDNSLMDLPTLALLGETLPPDSVEYNRGDIPIGVNGKPEGNGLDIGATIRNARKSNSWAVLKNVEQSKPYAELLYELTEELRPTIEAATGEMLHPQGFIFISSPGAVTPYHFDPEHNILLQLRGHKKITVFPAGDRRFASDLAHEAYHTGGARELKWDDRFKRYGLPFNLYPGDAVYVPVMAPHFVQNGNDVSISLSITWRSDWSYAEADARAFNAWLRAMGMKPNAPGRWPASNKAKASAMRVLRRLSRSA